MRARMADTPASHTTRAPEWLFALAVAVVPVLVILVVHVVSLRFVRVTGDEPHYLVIADSVAHDFDLTLQNNYERPEIVARFGRMTPHVFQVDRAWMPYHGPGLGILLAVPFVLAGSMGGRVTLGLCAGLLPLTLVRWFRSFMPRRSAAWLTFATVLSVPVLFGSTLIFPDLLAGILATALVIWIVRRVTDGPDTGGWAGWAAFWLVTGLLPWLNLKFAPAAAVLMLAGVAVAWRASRAGHVDAAARAWTTCALAAIGIVSLAVFNDWAYHSLFGRRGPSELTTSGLRALLIFLGLHFDQSQGMFFQQPLLLVGVAALVPFVRARPGLAAFWLAAYLSLIVPNSFELARFGMAGPDGRFGWSAEWLWLIPLGFIPRSEGNIHDGWVKPVAIAVLAYQITLAIRWLPLPTLLFPRLNEQITLRDSLFPVGMRAPLPSYYLWDFRSYLTYFPNVVATACAVVVAAAGAFVWRPSQR